MRNFCWIITVVSLFAMGCASSPKKPAGKSASSTIKADAPTYIEKVDVISVGDVASSLKCPRDGSWRNVDWRKAVGMANACVKAKVWGKVEAIGNHLSISAHLTPWGPYYLSLAATQRGDYPRALWMLELALKKAPQEGLFHYQLGRVHWEMKNDQEALKSLGTAAQLNPDLTDAHWVMGQIALQQGQYKEADQFLTNAIRRNKRHYPALLAMASVKAKMADWVEAESFLYKAIRANPRTLKARLALAEIQEMQLKRLTEALTTYKEIRQLSGARKLDDRPTINLDEKIKGIEQSLSQVSQPKKVSSRKPTAEKKVSE